MRRYGNIIKLISAKTEYGRLAQLVEHLLDVQEVTGSSPVPSTKTRASDFGQGLFVASSTNPCQRRTVQDSNSNEQRQGIIVAMVSCLLCDRMIISQRLSPVLSYAQNEREPL